MMKKEKHIEYVERKEKRLRRRVEEIQRHNTVKEYRKHFKYTKNLTKEYEPRNLDVLDVNGQLLSEDKKKW